MSKRPREWTITERFDGRTAQYVLNHKPDAALVQRIRAYLREELRRARASRSG
jgi:hypothetical protein